MADNKSTDQCDILFEYLRSILYDSQIKQPDMSKLDESFLKLGVGLQFLHRAVEEMKAYSEDLSKGNLSGRSPSKDNFLCSSLKNLHANLIHLTWQAKQVAVGDYSQHVSYLGEFSDAFNTMIAQLKDREERLREEIEKAKRHVEIIEEYNELFVNMTIRRNETIIVVDAGTHEILFCNKQVEETGPADSSCDNCGEHLSFIDEILQWQDDNQYKVWERGDAKNGYFRITSFRIEWRQHSAFAHVVENITENKQAEDQLASKAYYDAGTGIHNRYFFEEYMAKQLEKQINMVFCFMDLDGLKYVNDNFGHNEGDIYIRRFVTEISSSFRTTDVFARIGGDEFCLALPRADIEVIEHKFERVRDHFVRASDSRYPAGFSYGLVEIHGETNEKTLKQIMDEADQKMYQYKKKHKVFPPRPQEHSV